MRATLYIGILVGVLIFVAIMWHLNQNKTTVEPFVDPTSTPTTTTTEPVSSSTITDILAKLNANPADFKYIEPREDIPLQDKLLLYLTSFSDKTLYDIDTYIPSNQRWNNHLKDNQSSFLLTTNVLPATIKPPHGLSLKGLTIKGIKSDDISPDDYKLGSFTATFYCRFNTITFEGENHIEVFSIYVETPHYVSLHLRPHKKADNTIDDTQVDILLQLGNSTNTYIVTKPKEALLASGNYVLLTFVYDETEITVDNTTSSKVLLYIGNNEQDNYSALVTPKPNLVLGNSQIRINGTANVDASLQAFAFYKSAMTFETHKQLLSYFQEQQSGVKSLLDALKEMTQTQLSSIQKYLEEQTTTAEDLRKELEKCTSSMVTIEKEKPFKYNINLTDDMQPVSKADLESCSILSVKKRGSTEPAPPPTAASATTTPTTTATTTPAPEKGRFFIDVPFLKNIIGKSFD